MAANDVPYIDPSTGLPQFHITEDESGLHVPEHRHLASSRVQGGTHHPSPDDVCDLSLYMTRFH